MLMRMLLARLLVCGFLMHGSMRAAETGAAPASPHPPLLETRFVHQARQLTYEGLRAGEGYFSPDGSRLVFQSEREPGNPFYQIYTLDLRSGATHRISPGIGKTTCAFFRPGSDEVLFASTHLDPASADLQKAELEFRASGKQRRYAWDYDEHMDIFVARSDGSNLRRLTATRGYDAEAAYSPDGRRIVFTSLRQAFEGPALDAAGQRRLETDPAWFADIYLMNADGTNVRRLTTSPGYDGGPFFSPDGRRIVWRRFDEKGVNADIYTIKIDGTDERRVTDFQAMSWAPYYHPSGRYIIFTANKLGFDNFELFVVDVAGTREPVRVTYTPGFDGLPVFAPDGRKLAWTANRTADGKSQLFVADWDHAAAQAAIDAAPRRGSTPAPTPVAQRPPTPKAAADTASRPVRISRLKPEIREEDLRPIVEHLASDALQGRETGSEGSRAAAQFLAQALERAGVKPFGDSGGWLQRFQFTSGARIRTNDCSLTLEAPGKPVPDTATLALGRGFLPFAFSASAAVEGDVVFAGYGLHMPGKLGEGYDSYAGLDVSNKVVLVLRYVPEGVAADRRQELNRYAGLRYKAMLARDRGARALLVATGPNSPNAGALAGFASDTMSSGSGIPAASISGEVATAIFAAAGKDLKAAQDGLDNENPHAETAFALPGVRVRLALGVEQVRSADANVIGLIPPGTGSTAAEYVLVGAHYDHLGHGREGSLQTAGEEGQIHNGADDNASGTAAVFELASALAAERRRDPAAFRRGVIVAFWSGEEIGLIGSTHFAEHPPVPLSNVVACINFDMVGRLRDNRLVLQGVGSSDTWRGLAERRNAAAGFQLVLQEDPYLPTDVTAFYPKGIPVLNFFTGGHPDYHRPTDDPATLNFPGLERVARLGHGIVAELAAATERPAYQKVARGERPGGSRDSLRAYLGTIPDYATEVEGVKLSGVRGGSPAEKAGLRGGDVIVEFAGKKIVSIYDYTYGLDAVKIGVPVEIVVLREGQRVKITVTPEARR